MFTLSPRKRRVNLENRDPEDVYDRDREFAPQSPLPTNEDSGFRPSVPVNNDPGFERRPRLFGDAAAPAGATADFRTPEAVEADPHPAPNRPRIADPYADKVKKLETLEREKPQDKNGRWKSFFLNGLEGMSAAARAAMQSGQNPLAAGLGGFVGRGTAGAIRPSLDEEAQRDRDVEKTREEIGFELKRREAEADVGYKAARPAIELKKLDTEEAIARERTRLQQLLESGRMTRAKWQAQNAALDRRSREIEGQKNRDSREKVAGMRGSEKIPETFYRGKDRNRLNDEALSQVLGSGKYASVDIRPEILNAYGNDVDRINRAIKAGTLQPAEVFHDPRKGAQFQQEYAAVSSRLAREAQEFDRALDMTSKDPNATRVTYADFEATWQKFLSEYSSAKDEAQKNKLRRQFEEALAQVRVAP